MEIHTVKAGDTIFSISEKYGAVVKKLALNILHERIFLNLMRLGA